MSDRRSLISNELHQSRDPRNRDRSRSDIRRPNSTDTFAASIPTIQPLKQEQPTPTNGVLEFFKTLGLNSQLIQALINANPQNSQPVQQQPQQPSVNNAQDFATFLSHSYGLDSTIIPTPNQSVNRDPRRRQTSIVTNPSNFDRPTDPRSNLVITNNNFSHASNNSSLSLSIDELYKQYVSTIDQSLLSDEIRKKFQRTALLDNELDKLHRMNIELTKNIARHSRRCTSTKDKDPLLKENENLQNELIIYIKTLKTTLMNNYPAYMFSNSTVIRRQ